MKKFTLFVALLISVTVVFATDIPPGGTNMINDAILNFSKVGNQGIVKVSDADHPDFDKAIEVNVTSLPDNYWNFQVVFQTNTALKKDDVVLVSFWARCTKSNSEAGEGVLTAIIEHNQTYAKPLSRTFAVGGQWTHLVYGFKSRMDLAADVHKAAIFFGHAVQTIEIADVQFLNYKNSITVEELPVMDITWAGMEDDAPWRAEAAQRIEKFRKGEVSIKLVDAHNNPVAGASVQLKMLRHKFGFGSAIDGNFYLNNAIYRSHVHELFGEVVFENDLKWRPWVTRSSHDYILRAIDSLHNHHINVRGHNLIWPGWDYLPSFLDLYSNNPERLKKESLDRIETAAGFTKGLMIDWDVINEPYTNHALQDIIGDQVMVDWFNKTQEVDPEAKRYINDYGILSNGGTDVNHQNGYFNIIEYIENQGGNIQGIGMQGHFSELVTGIPKLFEILDRFSGFNKEIKITEFDINSNNDAMKAGYTRDFLTAMFSYPYVKGVLSWGFWEGRHWRPEAAYYNMDWSIKPQGEMYKALVLDEWWTDQMTLASAADGTAGFGSCFLGTYQVEVKHNGEIFTVNVPVHNNLENEIVIDVVNKSATVDGSNHEDTPLFTSAQMLKQESDCSMIVYPNPADHYIHYRTDGGNNSPAILLVTDISGNRIMLRNVDLAEEGRIDVRNLVPGIYFLTVRSDKNSFTSRFTVR